MIERLKKLTPMQAWLLAFVVAGCIVAGMAGEPGYVGFLNGLVASLFAAVIAGGLMAFFPAQETGAGLDLTAAAPETKECAAASHSDAMKNTEELEQCVGTPHEIPAYQAAEAHTSIVRGGADLKQAIKNLDVLPAMPVIAHKLLALNMATEEGERMLLVLIGQDPQISAKILGLANSAMTGALRHITTVCDAAMLLGNKRVQSVAAGIAIISLMTRAPAGEFNIRDLWLHGFRVAFTMQGIARIMPGELRPSDGHIFLAGMLHDIGYLVLAYLDPRLSDKLHNHLCAEPGRPALEIEREILDICHDELGAELARHWNLPEEIVAVLRYHHSPASAKEADGQPLVHLINIAEKLLPSFGIIEHVAPDISTEEWKSLGISTSKAEEVKARVDEWAEQAMQFANSFT